MQLQCNPPKLKHNYIYWNEKPQQGLCVCVHL